MKVPPFDSASFARLFLAPCSQLDLSENYIHAEGAKPVADALRVNASLTALDVRFNRLGDEAKALLQQAVQGRNGFDLKMWK